MNRQDVKALLKFQRTAIDIRSAGTCDVCQRPHLLFYALPEMPAVEIERGGLPYMLGGLFCGACGFSNAGGIPTDMYQNAPIALPEVIIDDD